MGRIVKIIIGIKKAEYLVSHSNTLPTREWMLPNCLDIKRQFCIKFSVFNLLIFNLTLDCQVV